MAGAGFDRDAPKEGVPPVDADGFAGYVRATEVGPGWHLAAADGSCATAPLEMPAVRRRVVVPALR